MLLVDIWRLLLLLLRRRRIRIVLAVRIALGLPAVSRIHGGGYSGEGWSPRVEVWAVHRGRKRGVDVRTCNGQSRTWAIANAPAPLSAVERHWPTDARLLHQHMQLSRSQTEAQFFPTSCICC